MSRTKECRNVSIVVSEYLESDRGYVLNVDESAGVLMFMLDKNLTTCSYILNGIQVVVTIPNYAGHIAFCKQDDNNNIEPVCDPQDRNGFVSYEQSGDFNSLFYKKQQNKTKESTTAIVFKSKTIPFGRNYSVHFYDNEIHSADGIIDKKDFISTPANYSFRYQHAGLHTLIIISGSTDHPEIKSYEVVKPNTVPVLYTIVPLLLLGLSEIMVAVTLLEMSYVEASPELSSTFYACFGIPRILGHLYNLCTSVLDLFSLLSQKYLSATIGCIVTFVIYSIMAHKWYRHRKRPYDDKSTATEESSDL
ncbi:unnamed protein product [Bursaphelenchus okinawaensis]|uniref:Uncharacterized protein n=1 Tax=Bursaphelenchus okinawaensis TaxID=465554 RepID=A0A811KMK4_9BILA|nr:unnamed protein product [Bursaphelenchus okinawaensis]CAG9107772.1 unnamed protein product [Bursaphelenchus okinawaensis]